MPSYQTTVSKTGTDGKPELVGSHEFEASNTAEALAKTDKWLNMKHLASSGATNVRLYAGKVLLSERALPTGSWKT